MENSKSSSEWQAFEELVNFSGLKRREVVCGKCGNKVFVELESPNENKKIGVPFVKCTSCQMLLLHKCWDEAIKLYPSGLKKGLFTNKEEYFKYEESLKRLSIPAYGHILVKLNYCTETEYNLYKKSFLKDYDFEKTMKETCLFDILTGKTYDDEKASMQSMTKIKKERLEMLLNESKIKIATQINEYLEEEHSVELINEIFNHALNIIYLNDDFNPRNIFNNIKSRFNSFSEKLIKVIVAYAVIAGKELFLFNISKNTENRKIIDEYISKT